MSEWIVTEAEMRLLGVPCPEGLGLPEVVRCGECREAEAGCAWGAEGGYCHEGRRAPRAIREPPGHPGAGADGEVAPGKPGRDADNI